MSKYEPLWKYLKNNRKEEYILTYDEIKNILGFDIDHSFLKYKKESASYGYIVKKISLKERKITFINVIKIIKEIKEKLENFSSKEECIKYLVKKTGLSDKECTEAYNFYIGETNEK